MKVTLLIDCLYKQDEVSWGIKKKVIYKYDESISKFAFTDKQ